MKQKKLPIAINKEGFEYSYKIFGFMSILLWSLLITIQKVSNKLILSLVFGYILGIFICSIIIMERNQNDKSRNK
jgi:hypothetical protein